MKEVRPSSDGHPAGRTGRQLPATRAGEVVALCDLVEERMQDFAKELPAPVKLY